MTKFFKLMCLCHYCLIPLFSISPHPSKNHSTLWLCHYHCDQPKSTKHYYCLYQPMFTGFVCLDANMSLYLRAHVSTSVYMSGAFSSYCLLSGMTLMNHHHLCYKAHYCLTNCCISLNFYECFFRDELSIYPSIYL
jgi:hypothetical protein